MEFHRLSIFDVEKERLGHTLVYSVLVHALVLTAFFFLPSLLRKNQTLWGEPGAGGSGSISVGIVSSLKGLNLPSPAITTDNKVATDSKGLGQTEVAKKESKPVEQAPDAKAFDLQSKKAKAAPPQPVRVSNRPPEVAQNTPSAVAPYGEGGPPRLNYGQFATGTGTGGFGFGDGVFGDKYGWYVKQIKETVSANWQRAMIDPNIRSAPRVSVQFEIQRDGSVGENKIKDSSGIPSLDRSALRAILASRFPPLPGGETRLVVEFWFEYSK